MHDFISDYTRRRITEEDAKGDQERCKIYYKPFRPKWSAEKFISTVGTFNIDFTISWDLVFIVRVHSAYCNELLGFLHMINHLVAQYFGNSLVLVLPTEVAENGNRDLEAAVSSFISSKLEIFIEVRILKFPPWVYESRRSYLADNLCSETWKKWTREIKMYTDGQLSRFCDVNSPLHYLMVDITLAILKKKCNAQWLIVTNADNYYSPQFFKRLHEVPISVDVFITNMVHQGLLTIFIYIVMIYDTYITHVLVFFLLYLFIHLSHITQSSRRHGFFN